MLLARGKAKSASAPRPAENKSSSPLLSGRKRKLSSKLPKTQTKQPKTAKKSASAKLAQSLAQGSDNIADRHKTGEEPFIVVKASAASNEGQQNLQINMKRTRTYKAPFRPHQGSVDPLG